MEVRKICSPPPPHSSRNPRSKSIKKDRPRVPGSRLQRVGRADGGPRARGAPGPTTHQRQRRHGAHGPSQAATKARLAGARPSPAPGDLAPRPPLCIRATRSRGPPAGTAGTKGGCRGSGEARGATPLQVESGLIRMLRLEAPSEKQPLPSAPSRSSAEHRPLTSKRGPREDARKPAHAAAGNALCSPSLAERPIVMSGALTSG